MQEPYRLSAGEAFFYAYILDEFEHWSTHDKAHIGYTPALRTLATTFNASEKTIKNWINKLKALNLVTTIRRYDKASIFIVNHIQPEANEVKAKQILNFDDPPF